MKTPPLLHAALAGSVDGVEFFLGDKPHRLYAEFGKSKAAREDSRYKHLKEIPGGFDRAISKWLGADSMPLFDLVEVWTRLTNHIEQMTSLFTVQFWGTPRNQRNCLSIL
jgi:hypothetical protein